MRFLSSVIVQLWTANVADACCWGLRRTGGEARVAVETSVGQLDLPPAQDEAGGRTPSGLGRHEADRMRRDRAIVAARRAVELRGFLGG